MKSRGSSESVTVRAASAKRSSQVGSRPLPSARWAVKRDRSSRASRSSSPMTMQDRRRLAGDEIHQPAHVSAGRPADSRVVDHVEVARRVARGGQQDGRLGAVLGAVVDDVRERLPQADAALRLVEPARARMTSNQAS